MELNNLPRWDLSNVYQGLDSEELVRDRQRLDDQLSELESYMAANGLSRDGSLDPEPVEAAQKIYGYLERYNMIGDLYETLEAYLYSFITTDSYNQDGARLMSQLNPQKVRLDKAEVLFCGWVGAIAAKNDLLEKAIAQDDLLAAHALNLHEMARESRFLMSDAEESLAAELSLSGSTAWTRLQGVIISQMKALMEIDGEEREIPLAQMTTYAADPDEEVRKQAYLATESALKSAREPLAACLNGVKGAVNVLNTHRGRPDALDDPLVKSRLDRNVLTSMLGAMESAAPMMHRYRKAKARYLGKDRLAAWDLPAPVGQADRIYEWDQAQAFILGHFAEYSPRLEGLASRAFANFWIDAEPRDGKQVGGFCMRLPKVEESRIFLNYDGRLGRLATLAHELGHAYHNECLRGKSNYQALLPMTLAETASIFCETIVTDAILAQTSDPDEELAILDSFLTGASYLTLEIYTRYRFETEIFKRREEADLSADELCELMSQLYRETLGDTIVDGPYRSYDWAITPHYYSAELSYYNYPYTFGFLFSLGLYQLYAEGQDGFHEAYDKLLAESGMASALDLGLRMGIDIRSDDFWKGSYGVVEKRVRRFEALVEQSV